MLSAAGCFRASKSIFWGLYKRPWPMDGKLVVMGELQPAKVVQLATGMCGWSVKSTRKLQARTHEYELFPDIAITHSTVKDRVNFHNVTDYPYIAQSTCHRKIKPAIIFVYQQSYEIHKLLQVHFMVQLINCLLELHIDYTGRFEWLYNHFKFSDIMVI